MTRRSGNPWGTAVFLATFNAFCLWMLSFAMRLGRPAGAAPDPWLPVFLGFMWTGYLLVAGQSFFTVLKAIRSGRSTLHLDATAAHLGGWVSGVVEAPTRLHGSDIRLFVNCIETSYALKTQRTRRWQEIKLLDGARMERVGASVRVPFAVKLPEDGQHTYDDEVRRNRVNWYLRVEASVPGLDFEVEFEIPVLAKAPGVAATSGAQPRPMPVLQPDQLAARLEAAFERRGELQVMHLPFPVRSVFATAAFAILTLGIAAPGMPWTAGLDPDVRLTLGGVGAFITAMMLLALSFTGRAIEVGAVTVVLRRGLFGLGFHKTVATSDIVAVEETAVAFDDSIGGYGVSVKLRDGSVHSTVRRLRDPARARALAHALRVVLPPAR